MKHHRNAQKTAIIAAEIGWGSGFAAAERGPELLLGAEFTPRDGELNDVQNACELMVSFVKAVTGKVVNVTYQHEFYFWIIFCFHCHLLFNLAVGKKRKRSI
jgi:hypothetical protein